VLNHSLLDQLDSSLGDHVSGESVELGGEWTTSSRRAYRSEAQVGTGTGPFVDVVDLRWRGALTSANPFSGIAFLLTADNLYWVKAPEISETMPIDVSLHAYAGYSNKRATFTAGLASASLPGIAVACDANNLAAACTLEYPLLKTGRVICVARASSAAFFVLLIQRGLLMVGRKRLWRVREDVASSLPTDVRELLTSRRTGFVQSQSR
jgi:hypothetical protein